MVDEALSPSSVSARLIWLAYCPFRLFFRHHFHFVVRQLHDDGISKFLANFQEELGDIRPNDIKKAVLLGDGTTSKMATGAIAIPAPYTIYSVEKALSWTSGDVSFDGLTANSFAAQQITGTPQVKMWDGTTASASVSYRGCANTCRR